MLIKTNLYNAILMSFNEKIYHNKAALAALIIFDYYGGVIKYDGENYYNVSEDEIDEYDGTVVTKKIILADQNIMEEYDILKKSVRSLLITLTADEYAYQKIKS